MSGTKPTIHHQSLKELLERLSGADEAQTAELLRLIDAEYWNSAGALVESFVREDLPKDFEIAREDRDFLSFAVLDHPRLAKALAKITQWDDSRREPDYPVTFMHDAVKSAYRDALRLETLAKLRQGLEAIDEELANWPDANLEYIKYRDRLVADALGSSPQGQHLLRQYSELDERLEEFKGMERRNQSEGWQTGEERKQWLAVKQYMDQRHTEILRVLEPLMKKARNIKEELLKLENQASAAARELRDLEREAADLERAQQGHVEGTRSDARNSRQLDFVKEALAKSREKYKQAQDHSLALRKENGDLLKADGILTAGDAVVATIDHLLDLRNERRLVEAQIRDEETTVHQTTPADVRGALVHEIGNVRGLLRLCAKYARTAECSVPLNDRATLLDPQGLIAALREIETLDPGLYNNQGVRRFGRPALFLAPGVGDGVFDQDRNRLVIPQHTLKSPIESVANAAVLYRLDCDGAYDDYKLFRSYGTEVKEYAGLRSRLKLRRCFIRDYLAWVTREARGEEVLSREVREWFEANIAPRKDEPLVPREFRGFSARQIRAKLDEIERGQPSAERSFKAAMLHWLSDMDSEENTRLKVLPLIVEALKASPDKLEYLYSAGALYKRVRQHQSAIECFSRYAANAPRSWWTAKAQELCASCR